jgi:hypothetical protein
VNARQFLWGLGNGVMMLAIAGAFWLGLGISVLAPSISGLLLGLSTAVQIGGFLVLLWAAIGLRRRSEFHRSELRNAGGRLTPEARHIMRVFMWTTAGQAAIIAAVVWACVSFRAEGLIWPLVALAVSLHFVPLARVFHVRAYYVTGALGSLVALVALALGRGDAAAAAWFGPALAVVMWGTAAYVVQKADDLAARGARESWAT